LIFDLERSLIDPYRNLFRVGASQHPAQHVRGAVSPVLALTMSVMMLAVVVAPPRSVCLLDLRSG
jgi:hypothetical protein